ncbi:MAG: aminopeptidase P family protein [Methanobacteriota archaeon]|nr:MAG: aminopeptidase P family protein [Euryarchaeota archaeon]
MRLEEALHRLDPEVDSAIIQKKENIYYLTGFFPTAFAVLVLGDEPYLAVSEMDSLLAKDVDVQVRVVKDFKKELSFRGRVGIEKRHTTLDFAEKYLRGCEVVEIGFIDEMRQVKDRDEVRRIKEAIRITEHVLGSIEAEGATEKELAAEIAFEINRAADLAFDPIVASGENSAIPHHRPSGKNIKPSEPLIIDLGARLQHYNCDMTRTFARNPSKRFREVYRAVVEAQEAGIKQLKPGTPVRECDAAVRGVFKEYGFEQYFLHSTGHGVGLEVHEAPRISKESEDAFKEGMVVTVEPGVYIPGWGGVRIEDAVLVGKKPQVLTGFPKMDP